MSRQTRRAMNALANLIEDASERAVTWLRAKAERKSHPRPLTFPSDLQLEMMELNDRMLRNLADRVATEIMSDPRDTLLGATVRVRMPTEYETLQ